MFAIRVGRVPVGAKDVERSGEHIVVDEARVDGECPHQNDDVTTLEYGGKHLWRK